MKEKELKPCLLVFAGPNGSGKSTIKSMFEIKGKYTNADDVVASTGMDNLEAAKLVDEMRYESIRNKEDFSFETVLSSDYKMNILRKAKEEGYFIKCVFVLTANPELNVYRVESRVSKGGHDVPADKIIDRYAKSLANIKELIRLCDIMHVYDNTDKAVRIIRKHKDDISIFPNPFWNEEDILDLMVWYRIAGRNAGYFDVKIKFTLRSHFMQWYTMYRICI